MIGSIVKDLGLFKVHFCNINKSLNHLLTSIYLGPKIGNNSEALNSLQRVHNINKALKHTYSHINIYICWPKNRKQV